MEIKNKVIIITGASKGIGRATAKLLAARGGKVVLAARSTDLINELEKEREKPLRFLRYFIMANYSVKNPRGDEILTEDEIYSWITKDENIKQANYKEKPFDFVSFILSNAESYVRNGKTIYIR